MALSSDSWGDWEFHKSAPDLPWLPLLSSRVTSSFFLAAHLLSSVTCPLSGSSAQDGEVVGLGASHILPPIWAPYGTRFSVKVSRLGVSRPTRQQKTVLREQINNRGSASPINSPTEETNNTLITIEPVHRAQTLQTCHSQVNATSTPPSAEPALGIRQDGNRVKLALDADEAQTLVGRRTRPADFPPYQRRGARLLRRREPRPRRRWVRTVGVHDTAAALMRPSRAHADRVVIDLVAVAARKVA